MTFDWSDIINRAVWTFAQSFIGVLVAAQAAGIPLDKALLWKAVAAGVAAAVSVGKNVVKQKREG